MKYNRLAVFLENKSGSFYYINLSQEEMDKVMHLIAHMNKGRVQVHKDKFPLEFRQKRK